MKRGTIFQVFILSMRFTCIQLFFFAFFALTAFANDVKAQAVLDQLITLKVQNKEVAEVISKIRQFTGVTFIYSSNVIQTQRKISGNFSGKKLGEVLTKILSPLNISYKLLDGDQVLLYNSESGPQNNESEKKFSRISGTVQNDKTGELLEGAVISVKGKNRKVTTVGYGRFTIDAQPGDVLIISSLGYITHEITITTQTDYLIKLTAAEANISEITVGSRLRNNRVKLSTAVPVDVFRTKDVTALAQADLAQILTYAAPSFQSNRQTVSDGTDHIDPASLRGLGPDQTLVLINGKRRHNTALVNINGTVGRGSVGTDLNSIPVAAIDRIEVLRDGAAAQYGSDAIAGVINIVLKKNYKGFNISGNFGSNVTTQTIVSPQNLANKKLNIVDGGNKQMDFTWGTTGKNNSYLNVSGQWLQRELSNRGGLDNSPLLYFGNAALGSAPVALTTNPQKIDYYQWLMSVDAAKATQRGFDRRDMIYGNSYSNNYLGFINAGTNLSQNTGLYLTFGLGHRSGDATGNYRLPSALGQQPVKADGSLFYPDGFLPHIAPEIDDISLILGTNIKAGKWDIDISNTIGKNAVHFFVNGSGNASLAASDNVQTAFDAGKLSFLQNTSNLDFSRKYDLKNTGDYFNLAFGAEMRYEKFAITEGEANSYILGSRTTSGTQGLTPVYPGTGLNYTLPANAATAPGAQVFPGFGLSDAVKAHRNVYAMYLDGETQLSKLTIGTALRFEKYNEQTGDTYQKLSGKLTMRYEITKAFAVRGSVSNGFRAPSLQQRYFHNTSTQFVASVAQNTLTINNQDPIARNGFGVDALKPETSIGVTIGAVGKVGKNFSYSIDAYRINIKDRIVLSAAFPRSNPLVSTIMSGVDPSTTSVQFWTNAVDTRTTGVDIVLTDQIPITKQSSMLLSLAGNYNQNKVIGNQHASALISSNTNNPGRLDPNINPANDLENILFDRQQRSRIEVAQPDSKINFSATYKIPKWSFILRAIRWGQITFMNTVGNNPYAVKADGTYWNDVALNSDQTFSAKITTDLAVSFTPAPSVTITLGSNNIFDIYPDQNYIDPRNTLQSVYNNPIATNSLGIGTKLNGGYNASRDATNRGRLLYFPNQFGFNGRYVYFKLNVELGRIKSN